MTAPHAMVEHDSPAAKSLQAMGWTLSDGQEDGLTRFEPPKTTTLLVRASEDNSLVVHEVVTVQEGDVLVATAEDLGGAELDELREQIDKAREDPDYVIVTNFDIRFQTIRFQVPA